MCKFNQLSTSYGLVVKTSNNCVVLLKRKIPYCVQDFYHYLHRKKYPYTSNVTKIRQMFEEHYLPRLKPHEKSDYKRYMNYELFEDMYDFPHGQLPRSCKRKWKHLPDLFHTAYYEFQEETGFHFDVKSLKFDQIPFVNVAFKGLDGLFYNQYYFIVENVKNLKRHTFFDSFPQATSKRITSWVDDRLIYRSFIIHCDEAYKILMRQQRFKADCKHYLCLKSPKLERLIFRGEEEDDSQESETE